MYVTFTIVFLLCIALGLIYNKILRNIKDSTDSIKDKKLKYKSWSLFFKTISVILLSICFPLDNPEVRDSGLYILPACLLVFLYLLQKSYIKKVFKKHQ